MIRLLRLFAALMLVVILPGCTLQYTGVPTPEGVPAPSVVIASPPEGALVLEGVPVIIQARVSGVGAVLDRVVLALDGEPLQVLPPGGALPLAVTTTWPAQGAGPHRLTVSAERADGGVIASAEVSFRVVSSESGDATATPLPPTDTAMPAPTATATSAPDSGVTATFSQPANVRSGPGLVFAPPIGSFAAGQTTAVLARSPASTWFRVVYGTGEGWVSAALVTLAGDINALPVDPGPTPPTSTPGGPVLPTLPALATNTPVPTANISAAQVTLNPTQPQCNQPFVVALQVANLGSTPLPSGGAVRVIDTRSSDGAEAASATGFFPPLAVNGTFRVEIPLTVSAYYGETHTLTLLVDPDNALNETNESDNQQVIQYTLAKGACP